VEDDEFFVSITPFFLGRFVLDLALFPFLDRGAWWVLAGDTWAAGTYRRR
jgi:hypothetical protein